MLLVSLHVVIWYVMLSRDPLGGADTDKHKLDVLPSPKDRDKRNVCE